MDEKSEYQEVERGYVKKLLIIYLICSIILLIISYTSYSLLQKTLNTYKSLVDIIEVSEVVVLGMLFLIIIPSLYIIRVGYQIIKERRFPTSKMRVLRRTKIIYGDGAVKRGKWLILLGITAIIMIFISITVTMGINDNFINNPFSFISIKALKELNQIP